MSRSSLNMDEMVKLIVRNVISRDRGNPVEEEKKPPPPAPVPKTRMDGKGPCPHKTLELHFNPCLKCNKFCNCNNTHFPREYPSILVRSRDKKIVRLSKDMVRSSLTLSLLVDEALGKRFRDQATRANPGSQLAEEDVSIRTDVNNESSTILAYRKMEVDEDDEDVTVLPPPATSNGNGNVAEQHQGTGRGGAGEGDDLADLIDLSPKDKVLVMFDQNTEEPTLGISKEMLMKVDYFVCRHLDDVDIRVEGKRRMEEYFKTSRYVANRRHISLEDSDRNMINTFAYEDWEEDFFDVDPVTFFAFHQANQELLIWDFYWAIEKWIMLFRGFPSNMINGVWDYYYDPDYIRGDRWTWYGEYGVRYPHPKGKCHHVRDKIMNVSDFHRVGYKPRWWSVKQYSTGPGNENEEL